MSGVLKELKQTIKNWWLFLALGILLIVMGIWVMITPVESFITLSVMFSLLIFINGVGSIYFCIVNWKNLEGRGWYLLSAIIELIIGIVLMIYPEVSMSTLPLFIGFWLMFRSYFIISASVELRGYGYLDWGWIMLFGILLAMFSFLVIVNPLFGASLAVYFTATAILLMGISYIALGLQLKKIKSATIDKIHDFKKNVEKAIEEVVEEGAANLNAAIDEANTDVNDK